MELNKIQSSGSWGKAADDLNQNFSKVNNAVEEVKNATTRNKGYFSSDTELKSAFPSANVGDIAYVGSAYPYQTWAWDGSAWKKKNDAGGEESVNLGDYYTKEETNEKLAEADAKLSELGSKIDSETTRAQQAESALSKSISDEIARAKEAEEELENSVNANRYGYNVTVNGLKGGIHNIETAIKDVPSKFRMLGQKITFRTENGDWVTYHNESLSLYNYENVNDWIQEVGISSVQGDVNITNAPDYEDLTEAKDGTIKFADKEYSKDSFSGLGRVYLRKNIVDGVNVLTQDMISKPNTIYIIQYDYDLQGTEITIPENCVLKFNGGSISGASTVTGQNTIIDAGLVKIFGTDVAIAGSWNVTEAYPEWFGAKGDGVSDDTKAIKLSGKFGVNSTMVFQQKTYIVNVIQGIDNSQRHILFGLKTSHIKGNGAIIRLGDNNNCDLRNHKGFGSLFNIQSQESLVVENLTIDFNYAQNPIYQTEGRSQSVQENTQQNAFCIRDIKNVIIDSCTFIEHSGTNCIDWLMYDRWADGDMYVRVSNCKFLKCGKVSYYDNNGTIETAAHDVSTCALHYRTHNKTYKYKLDFFNNYIEGVGINAYNALECSSTELNFSDNIVEGFKYCVMPCAYVDHMNVMIANNKFLKTGCPISIWDRGYEEEVSIIDSFDNLVAINNTVEIDIPYWEETKDYICIVNGVDRRYGFLRTVAGVSRNYGGNLIIRNNNINYLNPEQIATAFETVGDISKVITFNLYQLCVDELTKSSMSDFIIDSNVITNSPIALLNILQVSKINHLRITNNIFYNIGYLADGGLMYWPITGNSNMTERGIDEIHILNNFIDNKNTIEDNKSILFGGGFVNPTLGSITYVEGNRYTKSNILSLISNYSVNINSENFFVTAPKGGNSVKPALKIGADIGHSYINTFWKVFEIWDGEKWIDGLGFPSMPASFAFNGIPREADMGSNPGCCKFNTSINKPVFWNGSYWVDANGIIIDYELTKPLIGDTDNRQSFIPKADSVGLQYFNTNLNKLVYWDGHKWVDADGINIQGVNAPLVGNNEDMKNLLHSLTNVNHGLRFFNHDLDKWLTFNGISGRMRFEDDKGYYAGRHKGGTDARTALTDSLGNYDEGYDFYDTDANKIYYFGYNGSTKVWRDAVGNIE